MSGSASFGLGILLRIVRAGRKGSFPHSKPATAATNNHTHRKSGT